MHLVVVCRTHVYSTFGTRKDAEDFIARHCAAYAARTTRGTVCAAGWTDEQHKVLAEVSPELGFDEKPA